jgi:hypothetical protein
MDVNDFYQKNAGDYFSDFIVRGTERVAGEGQILILWTTRSPGTFYKNLQPYQIPSKKLRTLKGNFDRTGSLEFIDPIPCHS